jgi:hypothetical protein
MATSGLEVALVPTHTCPGVIEILLEAVTVLVAEDANEPWQLLLVIGLQIVSGLTSIVSGTVKPIEPAMAFTELPCAPLAETPLWASVCTVVAPESPTLLEGVGGSAAVAIGVGEALSAKSAPSMRNPLKRFLPVHSSFSVGVIEMKLVVSNYEEKEK